MKTVKKYPWQRWPDKKKGKSKSNFHGQSKDPSWRKDDPKDELWISEAVEEPGSYRASVKRRYGKAGFIEKGTIKKEVIAKDAKKKGKIGKRARLARTLGKLRG